MVSDGLGDGRDMFGELEEPWEHPARPHAREAQAGNSIDNGARVLQIQNWFYRKSKGRQCKGRQPRNFDFLQLMLNAHSAMIGEMKIFAENIKRECLHALLESRVQGVPDA